MDYNQILDRIIKSQYRARYNDWLHYAKNNQILGLQALGQIYTSKGNKKLRIKLPIEKQMYDTHESFMKHKSDCTTLEEAEQNFRRKQITTTYNFHHAGYSAPKHPQGNIFKFKTLAELNLARPITQMAISFIDNWIQKGDQKKSQEYVLACLRSINSKLFLSDPHTTEMRTKYNGKKDWSLSKPVRMDKIGEDLFAFKPNLAAIQKQQKKRQEHKLKMQELERSEFAQQLKFFKDFKIN